MRRRAGAIAALTALAVAGCGPRQVDPCQGVEGTCLGLEVESTSALGPLDELDVHVWGGSIDQEAATTPSLAGPVELPAAVALSFPSVAAGEQQALHLAVTARAGGMRVGGPPPR